MISIYLIRSRFDETNFRYVLSGVNCSNLFNIAVKIGEGKGPLISHSCASVGGIFRNKFLHYVGPCCVEKDIRVDAPAPWTAKLDRGGEHESRSKLCNEYS